MSHIKRVNESCLTHECVMSHVWTSHVSRVNAGGVYSAVPLTKLEMDESRHTYVCVMSHV